MEKAISTIEKNSLEQIRVHLTNFRGHDLLDIRVYYLDPSQPEADAKPTRKGISVSVDLIPELAKAIQKALEVVKNRNPSGKV